MAAKDFNDTLRRLEQFTESCNKIFSSEREAVCDLEVKGTSGVLTDNLCVCGDFETRVVNRDGLYLGKVGSPLPFADLGHGEPSGFSIGVDFE